MMNIINPNSQELDLRNNSGTIYIKSAQWETSTLTTLYKKMNGDINKEIRDLKDCINNCSNIVCEINDKCTISVENEESFAILNKIIKFFVFKCGDYEIFFGSVELQGTWRSVVFARHRQRFIHEIKNKSISFRYINLNFLETFFLFCYNKNVSGSINRQLIPRQDCSDLLKFINTNTKQTNRNRCIINMFCYCFLLKGQFQTHIDLEIADSIKKIIPTNEDFMESQFVPFLDFFVQTDYSYENEKIKYMNFEKTFSKMSLPDLVSEYEIQISQDATKIDCLVISESGHVIFDDNKSIQYDLIVMSMDQSWIVCFLNKTIVYPFSYHKINTELYRGNKHGKFIDLSEYQLNFYGLLYLFDTFLHDEYRNVSCIFELMTHTNPHYKLIANVCLFDYHGDTDKHFQILCGNLLDIFVFKFDLEIITTIRKNLIPSRMQLLSNLVHSTINKQILIQYRNELGSYCSHNALDTEVSKALFDRFDGLINNNKFEMTCFHAIFIADFLYFVIHNPNKKQQQKAVIKSQNVQLNHIRIDLQSEYDASQNDQESNIYSSNGNGDNKSNLYRSTLSQNVSRKYAKQSKASSIITSLKPTNEYTIQGKFRSSPIRNIEESKYADNQTIMKDTSQLSIGNKQLREYPSTPSIRRQKLKVSQTQQDPNPTNKPTKLSVSNQVQFSVGESKIIQNLYQDSSSHSIRHQKLKVSQTQQDPNPTKKQTKLSVSNQVQFSLDEPHIVQSHIAHNRQTEVSTENRKSPYRRKIFASIADKNSPFFKPAYTPQNSRVVEFNRTEKEVQNPGLFDCCDESDMRQDGPKHEQWVDSIQLHPISPDYNPSKQIKHNKPPVEELHLSKVLPLSQKAEIPIYTAAGDKQPSQNGYQSVDQTTMPSNHLAQSNVRGVNLEDRGMMREKNLEEIMFKLNSSSSSEHEISRISYIDIKK
jgi:hypothetical protein